MRDTEALRAVLEGFPRAQKACVLSFGCQLNFSDGEKYSGVLRDSGYILTDDPFDADVILLNACAVRAHAESRVFGRLGELSHILTTRPDAIIGLCGCMGEESGVREKLRKSFPFVRLILGASAMEELPGALLRIYSGEARAEVSSPKTLPDEELPTARAGTFQASVPVMYGCDNFCTYCIVPYVRGRERSRAPEAIERETARLVHDGYKEILLLGQNVNSYGRGLSQAADFPALLRRLDAIEGDFVIRFMSSHPKDASEELLDTMLHSKHIEHHLHLPLQSGSDRVLEQMNRRCTVSRYLELVEYARAADANFGFSTDLMVGFPTETQQDFQQTLDVVRKVRYDNLYTFIYSPREGTKAAKMPQCSTEEEIAERMRELLALQREISQSHNARFIGQRARVLIEKYDPRKNVLIGKLREGVIAEIANGREEDVGNFAEILVTGAKNWAVTGEILPPDRKL